MYSKEGNQDQNKSSVVDFSNLKPASEDSATWSGYLVGASTALKAMLGAGQFTSQMLGVPLFSAAPISMMAISEICGIGFYQPQADMGFKMWRKMLSFKTNPEQPRKKIKATIIIGCLAFAGTQAMAIFQAGGSGYFPKVFAAISFAAYAMIGPGNMTAFLRQLNWLSAQEIEFFHPKELTKAPGSLLFKSANFIFSFLSAGTNMLTGAAIIEHIARHTYWHPDSSIFIKAPITVAAAAAGVGCSAVAVGMNIDGINKAYHDAAEKGGWRNFLLSGGNLFYILLALVMVSMPSNYTGILGASQTVEDFGRAYNSNEIVSIGDMITTKAFPQDALNLTLLASFSIIFLCGMAAQTINKGPATKQLLTRVKDNVKNAFNCAGIGWRNQANETPEETIALLQNDA